MKNYICINGNKTELTEEQLKQLGIEIPKANPFERVKMQESYYMITASGEVHQSYELYDGCDKELHKAANYCTDYNMMQQRALHETLSRLLWRYSMEHDGDKINWKCKNQEKWYIYYNNNSKIWSVMVHHTFLFLDTYFYTKEVAQNAIEEIIKPFMNAHPEFKF